MVKNSQTSIKVISKQKPFVNPFQINKNKIDGNKFYPKFKQTKKGNISYEQFKEAALFVNLNESILESPDKMERRDNNDSYENILDELNLNDSVSIEISQEEMKNYHAVQDSVPTNISQPHDSRDFVFTEE